jgi:hypothetical protein
VVVYDVESLVDYMLATGSFMEPETRLPLSDADLKHLDALARAAGLRKPSVWEARHSARQAQAYSELRFRRDALMGGWVQGRGGERGAGAEWTDRWTEGLHLPTG